MAIGLPSMAYGDGISKRKQVKFGGYNHTLAAENGDLWDMENLTSDFYPLLSPRARRWTCRTLTKPNGLYAHDGLYWADGTGFYADGELKGIVTDGHKKFASLGAYIVILPDKKYYNRLTGDFGALESSWSGSAKIQDGTYAGEEAKANTIYAVGAGAKFNEGDAVTISGATTHPENNKTAIIREIDGDNLRFYENTFTISDGGDSETLQLSRTVPELDYICENENRLWGCKGDTIYASKLGDIFNWNVFDGVATDSFAVDVASTGDFTACCSYLGYPCFFKEEHIYKVYGSIPSNFQVMGSATLGVAEGSAGSLAVAGEILFYLSRAGIMAYSGGIPQPVGAAFGPERHKNAAAGSDGLKYYVSMQGEDGTWLLHVYDAQRGLWHTEDATHATHFARCGGNLYFLNDAGEIWIAGNVREAPEGAAPEGPVTWMAEFGDFTEDNPNKKGVSKLQIRLELDEGARADVLIQFDSDGVWEPVSSLEAAAKRSYYLPIIPRRADHYRLKLEGTGACRVYSLVREFYSGSELKSKQGRQ